MKKADIGVGVGLILLSIGVFWKSFEYRQTVIHVYGPHFFPQFVASVLFVCAVALVINAIRGKVLTQTERIDRAGFIRMLIAIGICLGYLLMMQVVGFALATCLFLFVLMTFIGQQGMLKRVVSSLSASLIVWAIFRYFLVIPLPTGMFPFTF